MTGLRFGDKLPVERTSKMLKQRTENLAEKPSKVDIRPRNIILKDIEGWYEVPSLLEGLAGIYYKEYMKEKTTLKFTRWLARVKGCDNGFVSEVGKSFVSTSVKVSCRHNDLVRLGDTDHYNSCMKNSNSTGKQQLQYVGDPDIAVAFTVDAAGKYIWRTLLRLAYSPAGVLSLVAYRVYGNGPTDAILKTLSAKTGYNVYKAADIRNRAEAMSTAIKFVSPTKHNNPYMKRPIWTDHFIGYSDNNRITIMVSPDAISF